MSKEHQIVFSRWIHSSLVIFAIRLSSIHFTYIPSSNVSKWWGWPTKQITRSTKSYSSGNNLSQLAKIHTLNLICRELHVISDIYIQSISVSLPAMFADGKAIVISHLCRKGSSLCVLALTCSATKRRELTTLNWQSKYVEIHSPFLHLIVQKDCMNSLLHCVGFK